MTIKGYAAHFGRANKNNERLTKDAFDAIIREFEKGNVLIPINVDHDNDHIIGKVVKISKDEIGLFIEAEIFDDVPECEYYKTLIENGLFTKFSTEGFIKPSECKDNSDGTYTVSNFRLTAVAIVNQPADPKASLSVASVKEIERYAEFDIEVRPTVKVSIYSLI